MVVTRLHFYHSSSKRPHYKFIFSVQEARLTQLEPALPEEEEEGEWEEGERATTPTGEGEDKEAEGGSTEEDSGEEAEEGGGEEEDEEEEEEGSERDEEFEQAFGLGDEDDD